MQHTHEVILDLDYTFNGRNEGITFYYNVTILEDLKQGFLKRFGNYHFHNRLERQRYLVKKYTHTATSVYDWVTNISKHTDFTITLQYKLIGSPDNQVSIIRWPELEQQEDLPIKFKYQNRGYAA